MREDLLCCKAVILVQHGPLHVIHVKIDHFIYRKIFRVRDSHWTFLFEFIPILQMSSEEKYIAQINNIFWTILVKIIMKGNFVVPIILSSISFELVIYKQFKSNYYFSSILPTLVRAFLLINKNMYIYLFIITKIREK